MRLLQRFTWSVAVRRDVRGLPGFIPGVGGVRQEGLVSSSWGDFACPRLLFPPVLIFFLSFFVIV